MRKGAWQIWGCVWTLNKGFLSNNAKRQLNHKSMKSIKIGRSSDNDIVITDQSVSREHALLFIEESGKVRIRDLSSSYGTFVNDARISEETLKAGDVIRLGNYRIDDWTSRIQQVKVDSGKTVSAELPDESDISKRISVGRSASNDVVLSFDDISGSHAELFVTHSGQVFIKDKRSTNGTKVNGNRVEERRLQKGDQVVLGGGHQLDWEGAVSSGKRTVISDVPVNPVSGGDNPKTKILPLVAALLLVIVGVTGWMFRDHLIPQNTMERYRNSVVLLYHAYIYEIDLGEIGKRNVTITGDGIKEYKPGEATPVVVTGTGFFVSPDGKIMTNRHVAMPWETDGNREKIEQYVKNAIDEQVEKLEQEKFNRQLLSLFEENANIAEVTTAIRSLTKTDVKVTGKTVFLGAGLPDTYINQEDDFIECTGLEDVGEKDIDLAVIQVKSKKLPGNVVNYVKLDDAILEKAEFKPGMKLVMIGYPAGFTLGETTDGLKVTFQEGTLSREPDRMNFGHNLPAVPGASGSPIFDKSGHLVGVNNAQLANTQTFNFGVLASHAVNLYNKTK